MHLYLSGFSKSLLGLQHASPCGYCLVSALDKLFFRTNCLPSASISAASFFEFVGAFLFCAVYGGMHALKNAPACIVHHSILIFFCLSRRGAEADHHSQGQRGNGIQSTDATSGGALRERRSFRQNCRLSGGKSCRGALHGLCIQWYGRIHDTLAWKLCFSWC